MPEHVSRWQPNWRWGEKDRVFWGASPHEIGSYIHTLLYWCVHTPLLCTRLGARLWKKNNAKEKKRNPHSPFFPELFLLNHSRCASTLRAPSLKVWSFQLHHLLCFVERSEELLLQQISCLGQSPQKSGDLAPPRGTQSAPFPLCDG